MVTYRPTFRFKCKNIVYIDTPLSPPGGGQQSLYEILKFLTEENRFHPFVIVDKKTKFDDMLREIGVGFAMVDSSKIGAVMSLLRLLCIFKLLKPLVVHCNSAATFFSFLSAIACQLLGIPFIWHNRVVESAKFREKIITHLSTKVICISESVKSKFRWVRDKNKIIKIFNAVDVERFKPDIEVGYLKKEFGITDDTNVVGTFSRIDWWKGHDLLVDVVQKIFSFQGLKFKLLVLVVGEGPEKMKIMKRVEKLNMSDKFIFTGYRSDIPELMNLCDVILNLSTEPEPFGRVIIEAMACGKVVIATNLGGPCEIIEDNIDGFLVEPNASKIAELIVKVLHDKELIKKISGNARKKAVEEFSVKKQIEKIKQLYSNVIKK